MTRSTAGREPTRSRAGSTATSSPAPPGRDRIDGGAGPDLIRVRDGERDVARCGSGLDRVLADRFDVVARDCNEIVR